MKKYLVGWPHKYNITDWAGILKTAAELFDEHIESWEKDKVPEQVFYWTRDKGEILADVADEDEASLERIKEFLAKEYVPFGVYENDHLTYFCGYTKYKWYNWWHKCSGDDARVFEDGLPDPKADFKPAEAA